MSALKKPIPFGKYYLLERINVGGMAEVFKAKTFGVEGFERLLAVKRILPNIAEDEEFITMFIDEAKIAVQLQHANIAQIFDLGKVDDSFFIALEFVHGRDLRSIFDRVRSRGDAVPIAMACHIIMQVCEGLDYAHNKRDAQGRELNLVHRDISPQNVLIGYEGEVKLIDFGIAKAAGKASKTQAGILKGKFGYMSPEQVRGLPIDRRSDVFAVGIVLYELLTGERLFVGESDFSTLEKVRNVEIVPPSSYNKKIPPELERVVLKALARDPEDRYQNAIDLHDDLQSFLYSVGEFYSRKDLAAWMKKMFSAEIEEDNAKLEQFRQVAPAVQASTVSGAESLRRATAPASPAARNAPPPLVPSARSSKGEGEASASATSQSSASDMSWDDEELDTQIYDKNPEMAKAMLADEAFFEDEDRTVANEPPPDILLQARPPDALPTPRPQPAPARPFPIDAAALAPTLDPPPAAPPGVRRPTLVGIPLPATASRAAPSPPAPTPPPIAHSTAQSAFTPTPPPLRTSPGLPPPRLSGARQTGINLPAVAVPHPPPAPAIGPPSPHAPFGAGSFVQPGPAARKVRGGLLAAGSLLVLVGLGSAFWYYATTRPGRLELTTSPADAVVLIDNVKIGDRSPLALERPAGPYTLSVTRDGYVRSDQNVELRAGQTAKVSVALEPSPDTGFELTSEPPGGLVWLDGNQVTDAKGPARTDFRALRIPPGHHVLEIKGESKFKAWRQEVDIQPGQIQRIRAVLAPAGASESSRTASVEVKPSEPPPPPARETTAGGAPSHAVAAAGPTNVGTSTNAGTSGGSSAPPSGAAASGTTVAAGSAAHATTSHSSGSSGGSHSRPGASERSRGGASSGADPFAEQGEPGGASPTSGRREVSRESGRASRSAESTGGDCTITVNSIPWSEVWIDGRNTTKHTPLVDFKVPCGKHKMSFKRADMHIDQTETITVRFGETFKQRYTLATDE